MAPQTWLITGCSTGLGLQFAQDILKRGDKVVATARGEVSRLQALRSAGAYTYSLDVTAPLAEIRQIMKAVMSDVGGIDVLVNNAGYVEGGIVEEAGEEFFRKSFETNFFGALKVTQAILPHFRASQSGTIAFISSIAGWNGDYCGGPYVASKFAMEGLFECLRAETAHLGIRNIIFELGFFRSNIWHPDNVKWDTPSIPDYAPIRDETQRLTGQLYGNEPGDPEKYAKIMIDVITGEGIAEGRNFPERLPIGPDGIKVVKDKCRRTLKIIEAWEAIVSETDIGPSGGEGQTLQAISGDEDFGTMLPRAHHS